MAEFTIQIPDELAQRLEPLQNRLPELLWRLLDVVNLPITIQPTVNPETTADNLALSCLSCNRHKGSDFATIDQLTQEIVPLFNPRRLVWDEHFYLENASIEGKTQIGQGTARLLQFNVPNRVLSRQVLISQGQYP
jgi:hypothetical protein